MRSGDLVELRPPAEILATLDDDGCADGLPFMPEMLEYFGRHLRVTARLERACDTHTWSGTRRLMRTVTLDDLRCDGSAHDGCAARCRLFWREVWLRKVSDGAPSSDDSSIGDPAFSELERLTRNGTTRGSNGAERIYRCQATELLRASHPVRWWSPISLVREVTCGNVRPGRFVRVMAGAVVRYASKRLLKRGVPGEGGAREDQFRQPAGGVEPGQVVRVRSREEISQTLDASGKTRGLHFDFPEMGPYCGTEGPVLARVDRFIDECSGRMVELKSDAFIVEGCACSGDHAPKRWFCPRGIYAWWRESWLEPIEDSDPAEIAHSTTAHGNSRPFGDS